MDLMWAWSTLLILILIHWYVTCYILDTAWILFLNTVNNMLTWSRDRCLCGKVPASFVNQGLCLQDRETTEYVQCFPQKMDGKATWLLTYWHSQKKTPLKSHCFDLSNLSLRKPLHDCLAKQTYTFKILYHFKPVSKESIHSRIPG